VVRCSESFVRKVALAGGPCACPKKLKYFVLEVWEQQPKPLSRIHESTPCYPLSINDTRSVVTKYPGY